MSKVIFTVQSKKIVFIVSGIGPQGIQGLPGTPAAARKILVFRFNWNWTDYSDYEEIVNTTGYSFNFNNIGVLKSTILVDHLCFVKINNVNNFSQLDNSYYAEGDYQIIVDNPGSYIAIFEFIDIGQNVIPGII